MRDNNKIYAIVLLATGIVAFIFTLMASSCNTEKRFIKINDKKPKISTKYCHMWFPCQDSTKELIKYIEGEPIVIQHDTTLTDTMYKRDTIILTKYITKTVKVTDTFIKDRLVYQSDKAQISQLQLKLDDKIKEAYKYYTSLEYWRKIAIISISINILFLLALMLYLYVRKYKIVK